MDNTTFSILFGSIVAGAGGISLVSSYLALRGLKNVKLPPSIVEENDFNETPTGKIMGTRKVTNVLSVLPNGVIRTRNGGYIRGYKITPSDSYYNSEQSVERLYNKLALLLTREFPKDTVLQSRFRNVFDGGYMLKEQRARIRGESGADCHPTAKLLKEEELDYYLDIAAQGSFRRGYFTFWVYVPSPKNGEVKNGLQNFLGSLTSPSKIRDFIAANEKATIIRLKEEEERSYQQAARHFRTVEQNMPLGFRQLSYGETCVELRINHNPNHHSLPIPPKSLDTDWQGYVSRTSIRHSGSWYLWHGNTPVTVITLFEPPESTPDNPVCHAGLMRFITMNPSLQGKCEVIADFITLDKDKSVKKIKDEIYALRKANINMNGQLEFKKEEDERSYKEKIKMVKELGSPGKRLINMRFHIIVKGDEVREKSEKKQIIEDLDNRAHQLISLINGKMDGAQAAIEDSVALRSIYEKCLVGELDPEENHREIREQALSLACFIPAESDWTGVSHEPHNFFVNTSGELTGVNLLRNPHADTPLTYVLGSSGSGKSVTAALLIEGFLATIPNAVVRACDYGGSLAPLVNLFDGRYFRFSEQDPKTVNVWDYEGIGQAIAPTGEQIELVTKDTLILLGVDETSSEGKLFAAIVEKCVRMVYKDEVPRNIAGVRRHEPTLRYLVRKLRSAPFDNAEDRITASRIAARLENFEGNPWVDAETDESFRTQSRFDVFEMSSLKKLPKTLQSCLAFRIGSRVGSGDEDIEGFNPPTLVVFDEVHQLVSDVHLKYTLRGAEETVRHGRKKNKVPLLITHSFDDIIEFPGLTSNIGNIFCGSQDDITSLAKHRKWNERVVSAIYNLDNQKGLAHQFVYATGQGEKQKITTLQVYLSPIGLWTFTTDPPEDEARKVLAQALPHWKWSEILVWLAANYPRGLAYYNLKKIDKNKLDKLIEDETNNNPNYKKYIREMRRLGNDVTEYTEEIDMAELLAEAADLIDKELDQIAEDNFVPITQTGNKNRLTEFGMDLDMPGLVIDTIQQEQ